MPGRQRLVETVDAEHEPRSRPGAAHSDPPHVVDLERFGMAHGCVAFAATLSRAQFTSPLGSRTPCALIPASASNVDVIVAT
jgi:hypothetical protein